MIDTEMRSSFVLSKTAKNYLKTAIFESRVLREDKKCIPLKRLKN